MGPVDERSARGQTCHRVSWVAGGGPGIGHAARRIGVVAIAVADRTTALPDGRLQGNLDGSAKVKNEPRYDRNPWNTRAQLQLRFSVITRYPIKPNTYSPDANPSDTANYAWLDDYEKRTGHSVPIHIDAVPGGFASLADLSLTRLSETNILDSVPTRVII